MSGDEKPVTGWYCPHMAVTGAGVAKPECSHGCEMTPIYPTGQR